MIAVSGGAVPTPDDIAAPLAAGMAALISAAMVDAAWIWLLIFLKSPMGQCHPCS